MSQFGKRIREARRERKISLRVLAKQIGISFTYLSKIESGEMAPPAEDKIQTIAHLLDIDPDELFNLADRVPTDLTDAVLRPTMPKILRASKDLSNEQLEEMLKWVNRQNSPSKDGE